MVFLSLGNEVASAQLEPVEQLGKSIFFDAGLSINQNQSCATCHDPEAGWTGFSSDINATGAVYEGSILGRFGNRKPPSSAYATPSPILHFVLEKENNKNKVEALFIGGNFWDGRATGEKLGNPAADQAQGPFLNPVEQALPDNACVVYRVCNPMLPSDYPVTFGEIWGADACAITWPVDVETQCAVEGSSVALSPDEREKVERAYDQIALSIAAYEDAAESNAFTSKYDYYLAGLVDLTKEEKKGMNLFMSKGKCANCHLLKPGPNGEPPLFTDFTFDNLGLPRNPENPFYSQTEFNPQGEDWVDMGLGGFLASRVDYQQYAAGNYGKQKVPTLRNVEKRPYPGFVKAFGHNGYFKSLKGIVHFYNTRDVKPACPDPLTTEADALAMGCWPVPEVAVNVNTAELGDLKLTDDQEAAIVDFMKTLSDGFALP
jgi:cytochrome c peroxidase